MDTLKSFNGGYDLKQEIRDNLYRFFKYKWCVDKNNALQSEEDAAILNQLPDDVKNKLISNYLFMDFI